MGYHVVASFLVHQILLGPIISLFHKAFYPGCSVFGARWGKIGSIRVEKLHGLTL
jgi:hypothetical protein